MKDKRTVEEKKSAVLKELLKCFAIKTLACKKARIGRTQFYEWQKSDQDFAIRVAEIEEAFVDYVEASLIELLHAKDRAAIMFYLKAKGKTRGYS